MGLKGHDDSEDDGDGDPSTMGENWTPDPIEADPRKTSRSRRSNDILSMLVHIYGSKELFVKEFLSKGKRPGSLFFRS